MRTRDTPSNTAALVAALRHWAKWLPPPLCDLAPDPYGAALAGGAYASVDAFFEGYPSLTTALARHTALGRGAAAMALRTRCLDDAVRAFAAAGGRQVVILGAGLDVRAWRLGRDALRGCTVYEVDSPGSQRAKLAALGRARLDAASASSSTPVRFIAHDFEADGADALPAKLRDAGLDPAAPVLTLWEAVLMYLTLQAAAATLRAVRSYSGGVAGSRLALSYLQAPAARPPLRARVAPWLSPASWLFRALAWRAGETFKTSFAPGQAAAWLAQRGAAVLWDKGYEEVADELGMCACDDPAVKRIVASVSGVWGTSKLHRFVLADLAAPEQPAA